MTKAQAAATPNPGVLPLPEIVVEHHGKTLGTHQREWIQRDQVPPVLLLTGLPGVGKRGIVYHLAQWMLCERNGFAPAEDSGTADLFGGSAAERPSSADRSIRPCGECTNCRRALHGTWVDFSEIRPEDEESRGTLKVDQFRELKSKLGFGAHQGAVRVTLIPDADRMTPQAANSMLKLLEEPPRGWVFFLTASDPTLILPTVLSRCQVLRLCPFSREEILSLLERAGVPAERRPVAAELSNGSWGQAIALGGDEGWEERARIFAFLKNASSGLAELVEKASQSPQGLDFLLNHLEHALSELLLWSSSDTQPTQYAWKSRDGAAALAAHAAHASQLRHGPAGARAFWLERAERLGEIRRQAQAPLNRKILVQDLLMPWLGL
jgi:DNA polymerase-3 subunit delta'